ncbi:putative Structural maintenance of chromosomes protein 1 [Hibiscus syriacus]|uniref:Structural maintenance of chromosomes protein 1 n=1 Tax=Hibiscus syriacus TaxID=106335 RepID=A0A6A3BCK5_HIBSY|nr:putative Structural maintenance of chromosomes protein 1 [Hibiscus syriacus]
MLSDSNGDELHRHQKGLQIKQDDKFFTRLMSKETSTANSSCRVYYGGASGAVPFIWESHSGTPKHPSSDTSIPPLTSPPSYNSSLNSKSKHKKGFKPTFLTSIFPRLIYAGKTQASPSSSRSSISSSSSFSSWPSLHHSGSSALSKTSLNRKMRYFSCSRSLVHDCMDDDDNHVDEGLGSPTSTLCFGIKPRNLNGFKGCQLKMPSTQPSVQFPFDTMASSSRGRHSTASFFDVNVNMPSSSRGRRASSRFFDLNVESMEKPSSPPEEPLREPGADGAETGLFIHPESPQFNSDDDEVPGNVAQTDPPAHMYEANYGAMYGPEFADMPHLTIQSQYGYTDSYKKAWLAKQNVIVKLHGEWDASYNELPGWFRLARTLNPGTIVDFESSYAYHNDRVLRDRSQFYRVFWSYPQCVNAAKYCKPMVQIDETFLYGKYKQVLLLAVVQDGNCNILPVAFALVEGEDTDSWAFFLRNLRAYVITRENICVISDRRDGSKQQWSLLVQCGNHPLSNIGIVSDTLLRTIMEGYELLPRTFESILQDLRAKNDEGYDYISLIDKEIWTNAYDGGISIWTHDDQLG